MRPECIKAVTAAAEGMGRKLAAGDFRLIEDRIKGARVNLARQDVEAYRDMTPQQQVEAAAQRVAQEIMAEKVLKKQREAQTIQKTYALNQTVDAMVAQSGESRLATLFRVLFQHSDGKASAFALENRIRATRKYYHAQLDALFDLGDRGYLGSLFADPEATKALTAELYGKDSGNPLAKQAAQALQKVIERQINDYRAEGGILNALEDWFHPQYTSPRLANRMGRDPWVAFVRTKLDRSKYLKEDGSPLSDAEFTSFLEASWRSIALDGAGKTGEGNVGQQGTGALGNQRKAHRQLFFKDAEAWGEYHAQLGEKDMFSIMIDHVDGMASDIAAMRVLSHNPKAMLKSLIDDAAAKDALEYKGGVPEGLTELLTSIFGAKGASLVDDKVKLERAFDYMLGGLGQRSETRTARFFRGYRNLKVASLLGSLPFSMLPDQGTMKAIGMQNRVAAGLIWRGQQQWATHPAFRENLRAMGLALEGAGEELSRLGERNGNIGLTGKWATGVHRLSGATAINTMERSAMEFGLTATWGRLVASAKTLDDLHPEDAKILRTKGLTDTDWQVWKLAELDELDGVNLLTPRSINMIPDAALKHLGNPEAIRQEAILKLYGALDGEVNTAVLQPSVLDNFGLKTGGGALNPNSTFGEIYQTVMQFKAFPWAYFRRHYNRMLLENGNVNRAKYALSTMGMTTALAGAGITLGAMFRGEDPEDITKDPADFGRRAFLKGGGLGFYGDIFLTPDQFGSDATDQIFGPAVGDLNLALGAAKKAGFAEMADDPDKERAAAARDMVKLVKGNTPFQNLWYTRAMTDRWLFNNMQEMANPGAMERMKGFAAKKGTTHWWAPGDMAPSRAPDFGKAVGESTTQ